MPSVGQRMLNNAVSLRFWDIPVASLSNNATDQEIIDILKTCQSFLVLLQKLLCQYYFPTKRKLLETHAIPKNCPIYFSMIKKMPLNILQQKLQIYTQTGSSRGQWSHWFVGFFLLLLLFFCPYPLLPASWCVASKQIIQPGCLFLTILMLFEVLKLSIYCNLTWTWTRDYENRGCE